MKALKWASDGSLLLALVVLVAAVVAGSAPGYAVAGVFLLASVLLTVLHRRAQAAGRTARHTAR
ncbi:MAG: hypothetical protein JWP14_1504 [Frankiales bacterium]|nr:hypothetical protein [Frankiales bacterium]